MTSYGADELAIIVAGPYELSMTSSNPVAVNYVVQSLDEAIQRFSVDAPKEEKEVATPEPAEEEKAVNEEEAPKEELPKKRTIRIKKEESGE